MKSTTQLLLSPVIYAVLFACSPAHSSSNLNAPQIRTKLDAIPIDQEVHLTNGEWQVIMSPQQFFVMRRAGTEAPSLSGNALGHEKGIYVCSACGNTLYRADTKFDSGTGWPSFWQPIRKEAVRENSTVSAIFGREISCARCGSHLGHVFTDGPPPTGLRYCMNAVALTFHEGDGTTKNTQADH
ncbi:MAG TPA: peptide-methionine (R)-S-oxide reductase MsrB [Candidatus Udaeobacter sp.]|jgi:peptide-methionine (R)-S-oxide reductase